MTDTSDRNQSQSAGPHGPKKGHYLIISVVQDVSAFWWRTCEEVCDEVVMKKVLSRLISPLADFSCLLFYLLCYKL